MTDIFRLTDEQWNDPINGIRHYAEFLDLGGLLGLRRKIEEIVQHYHWDKDEDDAAEWERRKMSSEIADLMAEFFGAEAVNEAIETKGFYERLGPLLPTPAPTKRGQGRIYNGPLYLLIKSLDDLLFMSVGKHLDRGKDAFRFVWSVVKAADPDVDMKSVRHGLREVKDNLVPMEEEEWVVGEDGLWKWQRVWVGSDD